MVSWKKSLTVGSERGTLKDTGRSSRGKVRNSLEQ